MNHTINIHLAISHHSLYIEIMNKMHDLVRAIRESPLQVLKHAIVLLLVFVFPFSLFPFLQNLVSVNIVYVFVFGALLLLIISFVQFLISKRIVLHKGSIDLPVIILLGAVFLSFMITSTNKIQALLDPNMGFMIIAALSIFYFYGRQYAQNNKFSGILSASTFIISALIIILSLEPSKNVSVIPLELMIFFGFMLLHNLGSLLTSFSHDEQAPKVVHICTLIIVSIALVISFIGFLKQQPTLPSLLLSFKALFEMVKNPFTAVFGVGIDNYSVVFTRIKDVGYNQTNLWQFSMPNTDRSALFHIATTTGMVGLISFFYLLFSLVKVLFSPAIKKVQQKQNFSVMLSFAYLLFVLVIFPPSFLVFFLIFFLVSQAEKNNKEYAFDLSKSFSFYSYAVLIITACVLFGAAVRYLGSMYLADYFYAQSLVGIKENKFNKVYDNQKRALSYNSFIEQYHLGFARTHVALAKNIIDKSASGSASMLIEAIQFAIAENQIAIDLNPKKAEYWANLAQTYTIIPKELQSPNDKDINPPQTIAVSLFKKALELDPDNPVYYFEMGQIYLERQKFDDAFQYTKKAVAAKPNWPDAHYQLAMIYLKKNDINNAVKELETTLQNLDPKTNQKEYEAVKQNLNQIKSAQSNSQMPPQ